MFSAPMANAYAHETEYGLQGPAVDLIKLLFKDFGVEVKTIPLPWPRLLKYLELGKIDAVAPILYTADRAGFIAYSIPFDTHETRVFVNRKRLLDFKTWENLTGYEGLIVRDRSEGEAFDAFSARYLKLKQVSSLDQIIKMLLAQRADYGIDKLYDIMARARRFGVLDQIKILEMPVAFHENHIGFSKKSAFVGYLPQLNKKIVQLKKEGRITEMVLSFIGK